MLVVNQLQDHAMKYAAVQISASAPSPRNLKHFQKVYLCFLMVGKDLFVLGEVPPPPP